MFTGWKGRTKLATSAQDQPFPTGSSVASSTGTTNNNSISNANPIYPTVTSAATSSTSNNVFGVPINPASEGPSILGKFVRFLQTKAINTESLFLPAPDLDAEVQVVKKNILRDMATNPAAGDDALQLSSYTKSPQVVAELLRLYLASLPEPLLTFQLYDSFLLTQTVQAPSDRVWAYRFLLAYLPPGFRASVKQLLTLLFNLARNSEINGMDAHALASVFGPYFLRAEEDMYYMRDDPPLVVQIVALLIQEYESVLRAAPTAPTRPQISMPSAQPSISQFPPTTPASPSSDISVAPLQLPPHPLDQSVTQPASLYDNPLASQRPPQRPAATTAKSLAQIIAPTLKPTPGPALVHPHAHPSAHPPALPPTHSPAHPPAHPPALPPIHSPAHPPAHPPAHSPAHPPAQVTTPSAVQSPVHSPTTQPPAQRPLTHQTSKTKLLPGPEESTPEGDGAGSEDGRVARAVDPETLVKLGKLRESVLVLLEEQITASVMTLLSAIVAAATAGEAIEGSKALLVVKKFLSDQLLASLKVDKQMVTVYLASNPRPPLSVPPSTPAEDIQLNKLRTAAFTATDQIMELLFFLKAKMSSMSQPSDLTEAIAIAQVSKLLKTNVAEQLQRLNLPTTSLPTSPSITPSLHTSQNLSSRALNRSGSLSVQAVGQGQTQTQTQTQTQGQGQVQGQEQASNPHGAQGRAASTRTPATSRDACVLAIEREVATAKQNLEKILVVVPTCSQAELVEFVKGIRFVKTLATEKVTELALGLDSDIRVEAMEGEDQLSALRRALASNIAKISEIIDALLQHVHSPGAQFMDPRPISESMSVMARALANTAPPS